MLDVKERSRKVDAVPTIQCRVNEPIFKKFIDLAEHYNCSNAALLRSIIEDYLQRHKGAFKNEFIKKAPWAEELQTREFFNVRTTKSSNS